MALDLKPRQRDTLVVALTAHDMIEALNLALRVRKVTLTLDYGNKDKLMRLWAARPGSLREVWMITNTRTKVCTARTMASPDLQLFANDVSERLAKLGATLVLTGGNRQKTKPEAKLQLIVAGSEGTALTLAKVGRGKAVAASSFTPPGAKA